MVSNVELIALIEKAKALGAQVNVIHSLDAAYFEGRDDIIQEVQVHGMAGIGPNWMPALTAAERLRAAFGEA